MRGCPDRMEDSFALRLSCRIVAWMDSEGYLEYEAHRLDGGVVEQQAIHRRDAVDHPQHPYGVGRFVDSSIWMNSINRLGGDLPLKYRSSPNLKTYPPHPDGSPPPSLPPALIPDRLRQPLPPGLSPSVGHHHQQKAPNAMARRNERERKRVRLVNHGFATLRQYLPQGNSRKKLSKMETLRSAIEYIKQLQYLLEPPLSAYDQNSCHSDDGRWPGMASEGSSSMGNHVWEEAISWNPRSPGSAGSSPQTSLSPEADLIDFSSFS